MVREARKWVRTTVVRGRHGWLLPLVLAPACFLLLSVLLPFLDMVGPLVLVVMAMVAALFESLYAGLWAGQLPWMTASGAIWRALLWTFSLWVLALGVLAPLTRDLYEAGMVHVSDGIGNLASGTSALATSWDFAVLYAWHAFDAIPALDITKSLRWNEPVKYDGMELGLLVVVYRAAVLLPLIASLRGVWATRRGHLGPSVGAGQQTLDVETGS
jgi:hypothetical protein